MIWKDARVDDEGEILTRKRLCLKAFGPFKSLHPFRFSRLKLTSTAHPKGGEFLRLASPLLRDDSGV